MKKYLIIIILVILVLVGSYEIIKMVFFSPYNTPACTMEAKICPDGSAVGRIGPNCDFVPCPTTQTTGQILGWNTYKNFGIEFQYPKDWGTPQESISSLGQESIGFNFNSSNTQSFSVYTQQDLNPQTGGIENETFDQMISRFVSNDKYIYLVKDISTNGVNGKELFYNSAVTGKPYHSEVYFPFNNGFYLSFGADLASVPQDVFDKIISTFKLDAASVVKTDPATSMLIYRNSDMEFEYPEKLNTDYASLNLQTMILNPGDSKIDSNNCYIVQTESGNAIGSPITINNVKFCLTTGSDVGAGQLYRSYYYTALKNGKYYVIGYVVHTSNACGGYENSPDVNAPGNEKYKACMEFQKNYNTIALKPIQDSIATFKFIK